MVLGFLIYGIGGSLVFLGIDIYRLRRDIADVARMHLQEQKLTFAVSAQEG